MKTHRVVYWSSQAVKFLTTNIHPRVRSLKLVKIFPCACSLASTVIFLCGIRPLLRGGPVICNGSLQLHNGKLSERWRSHRRNLEFCKFVRYSGILPVLSLLLKPAVQLSGAGWTVDRAKIKGFSLDSLMHCFCRGHAWPKNGPLRHLVSSCSLGHSLSFEQDRQSWLSSAFVRKKER